MRALFLFLIVVVAFLLVLRFYPSSDVEGAEVGSAGESYPDRAAVEDTPDGVPREEGERLDTGRFLTRPAAKGDGQGGGERLYQPGSRVQESATSPPQKSVAREQALAPEGDLPDWLSGLEAAPLVRGTGGAAEIRLAEAVLHGRVEDVAVFLDDPELELDAGRRHMVMAFKEAMAGRRQSALNHAQKLGDDVAWRPGEQERLRAALTGAAVEVRPASARKEGPLALSMEMALAAREGEIFLQERRYPPAASLFSALIVNELDAPWESNVPALERWSASLHEAQDEHRWNPRGDWPQVEMQVEEGDSLTVIRKRYVDRYPGRLLCTGLIAKANRLTGYLQPGQLLRIPTEPASVLVDLSARRVVYFLGDEAVRCYEVGVGRSGEETITGAFTAGEKQENPPWFPRGQEMVPFGDPRNPLGTRWIAWFREGGKTSYGFHGTNAPDSIGEAASDGCIRFRNEDVEEFFDILPMHAPIVVRP